MGFNIFKHSLRLIFTNFPAAFRISLPMIAALVLSAVLGQIAVMEFLARQGEFSATASVLSLVGSLAVVFGSIWTAVAWHRFVLLDEMPGAVLPRWNGKRMLSYFGRSLVNSILIAVVFIVGGFIVGFVLAAVGVPPLAVFIAVGILIVLLAPLAYCLVPYLVAGATGRPLGFSEGWFLTGGTYGAFLVVAIVSGLASIVIDLPVKALPLNLLGAILTLVWLTGTAWIKLMATISIATTIYGVYVEGRTLSPQPTGEPANATASSP